MAQMYLLQWKTLSEEAEGSPLECTGCARRSDLLQVAPFRVTLFEMLTAWT